MDIREEPFAGSASDTSSSTSAGSKGSPHPDAQDLTSYGYGSPDTNCFDWRQRNCAESPSEESSDDGDTTTGYVGHSRSHRRRQRGGCRPVLSNSTRCSHMATKGARGPSCSKPSPTFRLVHRPGNTLPGQQRLFTTPSAGIVASAEQMDAPATCPSASGNAHISDCGTKVWKAQQPRAEVGSDATWLLRRRDDLLSEIQLLRCMLEARRKHLRARAGKHD
jgi:hypothetical protein